MTYSDVGNREALVFRWQGPIRTETGLPESVGVKILATSQWKVTPLFVRHGPTDAIAKLVTVEKV